MKFCFFLLSILVLLVKLEEGRSETRIKRNLGVDLPLSGSKLACDRGQMNIQCNVGRSIYVVSAMFGRQPEQSICIRGGTRRNQQSCQSRSALNATRTTCIGKTQCTIGVNENNLGVALTNDGERCEDTSKYLKLEYDCVADCEPPTFTGGVVVIGTDFALGATVTVRCRNGFSPSSSGKSINQITCSLNGSWTGGSISCRDIEECNDGIHACDWHADCINTMGGYTCKCSDGYFGDGFTCNAAEVDRSWMEAYRNETYDIETDSNCGGKVFETNGQFQSPNFPSLYPNSGNCEWVFTVPPNKIIEVEFVNFHLEGQAPNEGCSRDYVTFYDGPLQKSNKWLATYCGNGKPPSVKSITNQMRIEFKTDNEATFSGFRALYRSFNPSSICINFVSVEYPGVKIVSGMTNDTVSAGDSVTLGCEEGYNITENANLERICQNDNTWNDISNPCSPIRCGEPKQFQQQGIYLNATGKEHYYYKAKPLMYSCMEGFFLIQSPGLKRIIFCNQNGRWSNDEDVETPECRSIMCQITNDLLPPQYAYWMLNDEFGESTRTVSLGMEVSYNSFIEYSCVKGYILVGDSKRICKGLNNKWTGKPIICEEDNGVPGLTNFQIAIIASCISGGIIISVGASLLCCWLLEKKKKNHSLEVSKRNDGRLTKSRPTYRPIFNNQNHRRTSNFPDTIVPDWTWEPEPKGYKNSNKTFPDYNKNQIKYSEQQYARRPYMLPTVVAPAPQAWSSQNRNGFLIGLPEAGQIQSTYETAQRPKNRSRDAYKKYQQKFNK